jgi:hypothetical protein
MFGRVSAARDGSSEVINNKTTATVPKIIGLINLRCVGKDLRNCVRRSRVYQRRSAGARSESRPAQGSIGVESTVPAIPLQLSDAVRSRYSKGMPYLLQRIAVGMLLLGFAMIPGLLVLRFAGPLAAVLAVAAMMSVLVINLARRIKANRVSLKSFVTSKCDLGWHLHPAITLAAGLVFLVAGVWILAMPPNGPALDEQQMTELEVQWFGMIAVFLGVGVSTAALAYWITQHGSPMVESSQDSLN